MSNIIIGSSRGSGKDLLGGQVPVKGFRRLGGLACSTSPVAFSVLRFHVVVTNSVPESS